MSKKPDYQYSKEEAQNRFDAALRGARLAGHKQMKHITKKKVSVARKKNRASMTAKP
jgi:hypothetical protein